MLVSRLWYLCVAVFVFFYKTIMQSCTNTYTGLITPPPPHLRHYIVVLFPRKLALSTRTPALCYYKKGPSLEFVFSVIISSFSDLQRNRMTPERDLFCTIEWLTADYEGCLKKYPNEQFEGETHNCIVTNRNRFISEHSYFLCPIFFSS